MAESEPVSDFDWFENVTLVPAGSSEQENVSLEKNASSLGNLRLGFHGADILVTEGVTTQKNHLGTCVLLQNPSTWGKKDTSPRRFVITAAHCVAKPDAFGNVRTMPKFRLRLPLHPWNDFPDDKKKYQPGPGKTNHLYKSIVISKKQIFVHEKYDGKWQSGHDVALIAIPETVASLQSFAFKVYDWGNSYPKSASVNGYPMMIGSKGVHSHLPYFSSRVRSDNDEDWTLTERRADGLIGYPLQTKPGISGGAVVVKDFIVGIHNAKNEKKAAHGWGTAFTLELKEWIESKYPEWTSVIGNSSKTSILDTSLSSVVEDAPHVFQDKPVISWTAPEVADWLKSIQLGQYAEGFVSEGVSGDLLITLDEEILQELDMKKKLHRKKFKLEIEKLKNREKEIKSASTSSTPEKLKNISSPPAQSPPKSVRLIRKSFEHERPNIGDRFKVQGAERWKKFNDINEVVYGGEVQKVTGSYSEDGVEIGKLIFVNQSNGIKIYVIKATEDKIYSCEGRIDGQWYSNYGRKDWHGGWGWWKGRTREKQMRVFMIGSS